MPARVLPKGNDLRRLSGKPVESCALQKIAPQHEIPLLKEQHFLPDPPEAS